MAPSVYITVDDLTNRVGASRIREALNESDTYVYTADTRIINAITDANDAIRQQISYVVKDAPWVTPPPMLVRVGVDLAFGYLLSFRTDRISDEDQSRVDVAMKILEKISTGKIQLDIPEAEEKPLPGLSSPATPIVGGLIVNQSATNGLSASSQNWFTNF